MRTKEELLEFLNPNGEMNGKWRYQVVESVLEGISYFYIHEIYFDSEGQLIGLTKYPVEAYGEDELTGLTECLKRMLKACDEGFITAEEMKLLTENYLN